MPIRFQADADLNQIIVSAVLRRVPEVDFRTATAAGLASLKDAEVLSLAARDGRILVRKTAIVSRHYQSNFAPTRQTRGGTIASGRRNELPEFQLVF